MPDCPDSPCPRRALVLARDARRVRAAVRHPSFMWPGLSLATLVLIWGAYALIDGVLALVAGFRAKIWSLAFIGSWVCSRAWARSSIPT